MGATSRTDRNRVHRKQISMPSYRCWHPRGGVMTKIVSGITFSLDSYQFTEKDLAAIEKALGVEALNDDQRRTLQGICKMYCFDTDNWKLAPQSKAVRDWLKMVQTRAKKLVETLHALHDENVPDRPAREATIEWLLTGEPPEMDWGVTVTDLLKLEMQVGALFNAAVDAQEHMLKDKGGDSGDMPLGNLVKKLAGFFTEVTRERPTISYNLRGEPINGEPGTEYEGTFFNLVESFLAPFDGYSYSQRSHFGLGKFIQRTLSELRSMDKTPPENPR